MRNLNEHTITSAVLERQAHTDNPRLKQIMDALVRHLHDFTREVDLTEQEWLEGIEFMTDVGHWSDDKRQEMTLLSDVLGLSMLVIAQNNRKPPGCTEATVFGPFHVAGAPHFALGDDISNGAIGEPCYVNKQVATDTAKVTAGRTRPLCEYPTWPKYLGQGDQNLAASFECVAQ